MLDGIVGIRWNRQVTRDVSLGITLMPSQFTNKNKDQNHYIKKRLIDSQSKTVKR
jgi:hypothetical protein